MLSSNHDLMTKRELADAKIEVAMTKPARQSRLFDSIVSVLYKKRIPLLKTVLDLSKPTC